MIILIPIVLSVFAAVSPVFIIMNIVYAEHDVFGTPHWVEYIAMVDEYCLNNVDKILAGGNPVRDLVNAGLIPDESVLEGGLADQDCSNVHKIREWNDKTSSLGLGWK